MIKFHEFLFEEFYINNTPQEILLILKSSKAKTSIEQRIITRLNKAIKDEDDILIRKLELTLKLLYSAKKLPTEIENLKDYVSFTNISNALIHNNPNLYSEPYKTTYDAIKHQALKAIFNKSIFNNSPVLFYNIDNGKFYQLKEKDEFKPLDKGDIEQIPEQILIGILNQALLFGHNVKPTDILKNKKWFGLDYHYNIDYNIEKNENVKIEEIIKNPLFNNLSKNEKLHALVTFMNNINTEYAMNNMKNLFRTRNLYKELNILLKRINMINDYLDNEINKISLKEITELQNNPNTSFERILLTNHYDKFSFTKEQEKSIKEYKKDLFKKINYNLRKNIENIELHDDIENLKSIIRPLKDDVIVFRGIDFDPNLNINDIFTDKAFISTSWKKSIADDEPFISTDSPKILFEIHCKKGQKATFLDYITGMDNNHECEFLLPPNSKFKIKEVRKFNYGKEYVVDYMGDN